MKRLWTTEEFKLRQKRLRARSLRRRERPHRGGRGSGREITLTAPGILSLFDQAGDTLAFCNDLRAGLQPRNTRLYLNLENVTRFSSDAIFLMRALMDHGKRGWRTTVGGNLPSNVDVAAKIKATGFFAGFAQPPGDLPPAKGLILGKSHRMVISDVAAELVRFARSNAALARTSANACSQILIEAMTNTRGHAGEQRRSSRGRVILQPWSAGVYCEDDVAHFTFVDLGVGILGSARARRYRRALGIRGPGYDRVQLLQDAFKGAIGSSTGLPGRGLGLPDMKANADDGLLENLQVLTADVIGPVSTLTFSQIDASLRGTILRWRASGKAGTL